MERERTGGPHDAEAEAPAHRSPSELGPLIVEAQAAVGLVRFEAVEKINDLLIALRAPGNEAAEANAILAALDVSQLNGLVDGRGRDCRKEAVETLLASGFPHALNVSPEDLAHARRAPMVAPAPARGAAAPQLVKVAGGIAFLGAAWQAWGAANVYAYAPLMSLILVATAALTGLGAYGLTQLKSDDSLAPAYGLLGAGVVAQSFLHAIGYGAMPWTLAVLSLLSAALAAVGMAQRPKRDGT